MQLDNISVPEGLGWIVGVVIALGLLGILVAVTFSIVDAFRKLPTLTRRLRRRLKELRNRWRRIPTTQKD